MNKKLFSWKALAGLALLVAVGLTSCKQANEVDPEDPTGTTKPLKPSSSIDDEDFDWIVTINKTADFADQWKKVKTDVQKALAKAEADEINIKVNTSAYTLDGKTLSIPADLFSDGINGKIVNLVFSGAFAKTEEAFDLDLSKLKGAEVNVFLPADEFDMALNASNTKTTLYGDETTLTTLDATADAVKKNALTISDGVSVAGIYMTGAIADIDNVEALLFDGTQTIKEGKGAQVSGATELYFKNLIVVTSAALNAEKTAFENVVIPENVTLTVNGKKPQISNILGLGSAKKPSTVNFTGDKDSFTNIESITNAYIAGTTSDIKDMDIFTGVVFEMDVNLYTEGASDTEFAGDVNVKIEDDIDAITFTGVTFGVKSNLTMAGAVTVSGKKSFISMWQWDKSKKTYTEVKSADEDDLLPANADGKYVKVVQKYFKAMPAKVDMSKGKFVFDNDALGDLNEAYGDEVEAYEKDITANGLAAANANIAKLQAAWEDINGVAADVETTDDKGKDIKVKFTAFTDKQIEAAKEANKKLTAFDGTAYDPNVAADLAKLQGYVRQYADELAFVSTVNTAIDGSDWFEIYYAKEDTNTPEAVILSFDDCLVGSKAMDVDKANDLIDTDGNDFSSKKDIWFNVEIDGELLEWAGSKSVGFYLKESK